VALSALPFLMALGTLLAGLLRVDPGGLRRPGGPGAAAMALLLAALLGGLGYLVWRGSGPLRFLADALYAIVLTLGFGLGLVAALLNAIGGMQGGSAGPLWATLVLGAGALQCALALIAVFVRVVGELRGSP
jgi:hypothetical protein